MREYEGNMNNLSSAVNSSVEWRRNKVQELASQSYNQSEISRILQISQPTIKRPYLQRYIDERLPEEYEKCMVGLTSILKEAWNTAQQTEDKREKLQALSLAIHSHQIVAKKMTKNRVIHIMMKTEIK